MKHYGNLLGEGSYGKVYESYCKKFAIKVIDCCLCPNIYKELYFSQNLNHENILQAQKIKVIKNINQIHTFEFYFPKKCINLQKYLLCNSLSITYETKIKFMYQILNAVSYLHSNNIVHKDLKLDNFLVDTETLNLFLIDFGCTSFSSTNSFLKDRICALWLQPFEILNFKKGFFNLKSIDAWATGCILFALFTFKYPYCGINRKEVRESLQTLDLNVELNIIQNEEIQSLIKGLLEKNVDTRYTLQNCKENFNNFLELKYIKVYKFSEKNETNFLNFENFENEKVQKIPNNILKFLKNVLKNFLHFNEFEIINILKLFYEIQNKKKMFKDENGNFDLACLSLALDLWDYNISVDELRNLSLFFYKSLTVKKILTLKIDIC